MEHLQKNSPNNATCYLETKDFLVTQQPFKLIHNDQFKMLVTHPQPENLAPYYQSEAYISHTDSKKGGVAFLYQTVKKWALKNKVSIISKLQPHKKSVLDIGAGTGDFLFTAKKMGWQIEGVEINEKARNLAANKNINLYPEISNIPSKKYDVVTLWHVLEHLPNLKEVTQQIEALVKPKGFLVIAVPNYKSYDAQYYKGYWAAFDTPRHLWHFSRKSLPLLFSGRLTLVKTKPMIFDSFYVSLLSEKYKNKSNFLIRAFFIGLWSNIKALSTKEHSSIIYIFQKL